MSIRPWRLAIVALAWFAGCTALTHHENNYIAQQTWLGAVLQVSVVVLAVAGLCLLFCALFLWVHGVDPRKAWRR